MRKKRFMEGLETLYFITIALAIVALFVVEAVVIYSAYKFVPIDSKTINIISISFVAAMWLLFGAFSYHERKKAEQLKAKPIEKD